MLKCKSFRKQDPGVPGTQAFQRPSKYLFYNYMHIRMAARGHGARRSPILRDPPAKQGRRSSPSFLRLNFSRRGPVRV